MLDSALQLVRCPRCRARLELGRPEREGGEIEAGQLACAGCRAVYPIRKGIPRFVPAENYADSFGFEWQRFAEVQTDRFRGHSLTRDRFFLEVGLRPEELRGLRVLEAGCGGGRFSDVVLEAGAELYAFDLSNAVDKSRELRRGRPRLDLFQASIEAIPLEHESFDLVFCFGVLQHTPDPAVSFRYLVPFVKKGGRIAVDVYAAHLKQTLHWKYLVRPVTKRMRKEDLLTAIERAATVLVPISRSVRRIPKLGKPLSRLIPIFVHDGFMGKVPPDDEVRWAVLETFDALSPAYDRPCSRRTLQRWLEEAGFVDVAAHTLNRSLNYGHARKPS